NLKIVKINKKKIALYKQTHIIIIEGCKPSLTNGGSISHRDACKYKTQFVDSRSRDSATCGVSTLKCPAISKNCFTNDGQASRH
ncbi:MAG: hypothetical protein MJ225_04885, partial [Bacilli bacterium]|nr:hypothetical protein [Bacilli bacterium]